MNKPIIGVVKHFNSHPSYSLDFFKVIYDYLCVASDGQAGDCLDYSSELINEGARKNMFVDWMSKTAEWEKYDLTELPWSNSSFNWEDAYQVHLDNLRLRKELMENNKRWRKSYTITDSHLINSFIK